jgi:hypothetical protein
MQKMDELETPKNRKQRAALSREILSFNGNNQTGESSPKKSFFKTKKVRRKGR